MASSPGGNYTLGQEQAPSNPKLPALERWKACLTCRNRRTRCDGARPTCGPCTQFGRTCVFAPKTRTPGPGPSVILRSKLSELDERLNKLLAERSANVTTADQEIQAVAASSASNRSPFEPSSEDVLLFNGAERHAILSVFFASQHRYLCNISSTRFFEALNTGDSTMQPLPALVETLLLIGITLAPHVDMAHGFPTGAPNPSVFLHRIHRGLESSLEMVDRVLDYIQASVLLCSWYFGQGRLQEGQYLSAATFRLAVDCRLHQINDHMISECYHDTIGTTPWIGSILGRPTDTYNLAQRISTFWQCYAWDKIYSLTTGLPSACDEQTTATVTSVWPRPESEYEPVQGDLRRHIPFNSLHDLLTRPAAPHRNVTFDDLRIPGVLCSCNYQALALLDRATQLERVRPHTGTSGNIDQIMTEIRALQLGLYLFESALPLIDSPIAPHHAMSPDTDEAMNPYINMKLIWLCALSTQLSIIRSAASATNANLGITDIEAQRCTIDTYGLLGNEEQQKRSFQDMLVMAAEPAVGAIRAAIEIFDHTNSTSVDASLAAWILQVPEVYGFILTSPSLILAEHAKQLESQSAGFATGSTEQQHLMTQLLSVEANLRAAVRFLNLQSALCPTLRLQIQKIEAIWSSNNRGT